MIYLLVKIPGELAISSLTMPTIEHAGRAAGGCPPHFPPIFLDRSLWMKLIEPVVNGSRSPPATSRHPNFFGQEAP